jgi:S1-C subfamily serine protease
MKHFILTKLLIVICFIGFAQKTKITILPESADVTLKGKLVGNTVKLNDKELDAFVVGSQKGYVTYGEKAEEIVKKGATVNVNLAKINKLPAGANTRKIEFTKFVDAAELSHSSTSYTYGYGGLGAYSSAGIDIEEPQYLKPIPKLMSDWGFKMVGTNAVFQESETPDLALAGEITGFGKDSRGSGLQVSVLVNWSLLNVDTKKVIYTATTGGFSDSKKKLKFSEEFILALKDAAVGLMSDPKFQDLTIEKAESSTSAKTGVATSLPKITPVKYTGYGDMIKNVVGSVVTIKVDGGFGSGFIISKSGYLLTNHHVITGSSKIEVVFDNGFNMEATLIKSDEARDVALLKITGSGFKPLSINPDPEAAGVGTEVVAIGTPLDLKLNQTVTKGIVSGKREMEDGHERKLNFIQTDVSINGGNSGGPLLNTEGQVIGIATKKLVGKGVEGIGFVIPIGEAIDELNIKFE